MNLVVLANHKATRNLFRMEPIPNFWEGWRGKIVDFSYDPSLEAYIIKNSKLPCNQFGYKKIIYC